MADQVEGSPLFEYPADPAFPLSYQYTEDEPALSIQVPAHSLEPSSVVATCKFSGSSTPIISEVAATRELTVYTFLDRYAGSFAYSLCCSIGTTTLQLQELCYAEVDVLVVVNHTPYFEESPLDVQMDVGDENTYFLPTYNDADADD